MPPAGHGKGFLPPTVQAFAFIGQKQFTAAGQLRFFQQDGDTFVQANTSDATGGPEMTIKIEPLVSLQATDFVL